MAVFSARFRKSGIFERPSGTESFQFYLVNGIFSLKFYLVLEFFREQLFSVSHFFAIRSGIFILRESGSTARRIRGAAPTKGAEELKRGCGSGGGVEEGRI